MWFWTEITASDTLIMHPVLFNLLRACHVYHVSLHCWCGPVTVLQTNYHTCTQTQLALSV